MRPSNLAKAVTPLRVILVGLLLVPLDFKVGLRSDGVPHLFDLLNDTLGYLLASGGLARLAWLELGSLNEGLLMGLAAVAGLHVVGSAISPVDPSVQEEMSMWFFALRLLGTVGMVVFCLVMRRICQAAGLGRAVSSWSTTLTLMVMFYVITPAVFFLTSLSALLQPGGSPLGITWIVPVAGALPFAHGLLSTARMSMALPSPSPTYGRGATW
jgi:hypothetical protein